MNIEIGTESLPENFRWDPQNPVTGTTKFYVRVAEGFAARGHNVEVLYDGPEMQHNAVRYCNVSRGDTDFILDCNVQRTAYSRAKAVKRFQWTSFFAKFDTCVGEGYDRLFLVSDYVHSTLSHVVKAPVEVLELGCDMPTRTNADTAGREKVACYTSSPDRGGTFLDRIWGDVEKETGYALVKSPYDGSFSATELQELYLRSRFWVFPAIGTDSIVAALEAQACGCIPIFVPHMGLPETIRYGISVPDLYTFKGSCVAAFNAFDDNIAAWMVKRQAALTKKPIPAWQDVADRILAAADAEV